MHEKLATEQLSCFLSSSLFIKQATSQLQNNVFFPSPQPHLLIAADPALIRVEWANAIRNSRKKFQATFFDELFRVPWGTEEVKHSGQILKKMQTNNK